MIEVKHLKTTGHKANAIDKRAIRNLMSHVEWEIDRENLPINKDRIIDEANYIIVEVEGYENLAFYDEESGCICATIQPIDRKEDKLFPIQRIELKACYKRF